MGQSSSVSGTLEGIPVLIQNIQSLLPVKDAARTSVLSKSWLHAWSTIPDLRFHHIPNHLYFDNLNDACKGGVEHKANSFKLDDINDTLERYLLDNIPIEKFELIVVIQNHASARLAGKWLLDLATKTRVKEISLRMEFSVRGRTTFNLPVEILSVENLTKLKVITDYSSTDSVKMKSRHHSVNIKCVSLRELHLEGLRISQNILDGILSSCSSLEKVQLIRCSRYLNTIKVKNLHCLYKLVIFTDPYDEKPTDFVLSHLPNLRFFHCNSEDVFPFNINAHSITLTLGDRLIDLDLFEFFGLIRDYTSLDMIKSGCPFLESLDLDMSSWMLESFHFKSDFIKSLILRSCPSRLIDIQILAPKLSHFTFKGYKSLPSLSFPSSGTLEELYLLLLKFDYDVDASFFLKLRETLTLARKCHLNIQVDYNFRVPLHIDMNDLRRRLLLPPARNVQSLGFETDNDACEWERSPFLDALFEICHPEEVSAWSDANYNINHFGMLMLKEVLEKKKTGPTQYWPRDLEHVQIARSPFSNDRNWKTLTNSHRGLLDGTGTLDIYLYFKLKWR